MLHIISLILENPGMNHMKQLPQLRVHPMLLEIWKQEQHIISEYTQLSQIESPTLLN